MAIESRTHHYLRSSSDRCKAVALRQNENGSFADGGSSVTFAVLRMHKRLVLKELMKSRPHLVKCASYGVYSCPQGC